MSTPKTKVGEFPLIVEAMTRYYHFPDLRTVIESNGYKLISNRLIGIDRFCSFLLDSNEDFIYVGKALCEQYFTRNKYNETLKILEDLEIIERTTDSVEIKCKTNNGKVYTSCMGKKTLAFRLINKGKSLTQTKNEMTFPDIYHRKETNKLFNGDLVVMQQVETLLNITFDVSQKDHLTFYDTPVLYEEWKCSREKDTDTSESAYIETINKDFKVIDKWNNMSDLQRINSISVDGFGKRLHNIVTRVKSKTRQWLSYDNTKMTITEYDVKQCQPTLLAKLFHLFGVDSRCNKLLKTIQDGGDIYNNLINDKTSKIKNRKDAKGVFFTQVYGQFYYDKDKQIIKSDKAISLLGQTALGVLNQYKSQDFDGNKVHLTTKLGGHLDDLFVSHLLDKKPSKWKQDSNIIVMLLQRIESDLMRQVLKRVTNETNLKIIWVHDAIYTLGDVNDDIDSKVINIFKKVLIHHFFNKKRSKLKPTVTSHDVVFSSPNQGLKGLLQRAPILEGSLFIKSFAHKTAVLSLPSFEWSLA